MAELLSLIDAARGESQHSEPASPTPESTNESKPAYSGESYSVHNGCLYVWKPSYEGHTAHKIANFSARIVLDQVMDDGVDQFRAFTIEAIVAGRTTQIDVTAKEFKAMNWVSEKLGGMAIVNPSQTEYARTGIQSISGQIPTRHTCNHTGWRRIDGHDYYLHSGGGIGGEGNRTDIRVNLQDTLPHYTLSDPPVGPERVAAFRASLRVLDVAIDRLTFPVYAAIWRAILGQATFSIHISGSSGAGKSQLAALAQQHFGSFMDADHLPASWIATANATSTLAFHAKDALMVVDDFVPSGNTAAQQKLQGEADRLLRGQGNSVGRRRLSADGKLQGNQPPRGLLLSTGEDTPKGRSLNARLVLLPFPQGAMDWKKLTECQSSAHKGELAKATAAFIHWLAPQLGKRQQALQDRKFTRRQGAAAPTVHMRTPENLDSLLFGFTTFLHFGQDIGAISVEEAGTLAERCEKAFAEVAEGEERKHADNEPSRLFLKLIGSAISTGKAHLADTDGKAPAGERLWSWHIPAGSSVKRESRGVLIGWVKGEQILLLPEAAYSVAYGFAQDMGEVLPGSLDSVKRDLKEQSLLARTDEKRRTITIRRTIQGEQQDVLCFRCDVFQTSRTRFADKADTADTL